MLLYQKAPHILFPFSTANMNLHLSTMIKNVNYRQSKAFHQYMINNMNHKLVPNQKAHPGSKAQRHTANGLHRTKSLKYTIYAPYIHCTKLLINKFIRIHLTQQTYFYLYLYTLVQCMCGACMVLCMIHVGCMYGKKQHCLVLVRYMCGVYTVHL